MANYASTLSTTLQFSGDVAEYRFVQFDTANAGQLEQVDTLGNAAVGVTSEAIDVSEDAYGEVVFFGVAKVTAGATVAAGAPVRSDNQGRAVTTTGTNRVAGYAKTGGAVGEVIEVILAGPAGSYLALA